MTQFPTIMTGAGEAALGRRLSDLLTGRSAFSTFDNRNNHFLKGKRREMKGWSGCLTYLVLFFKFYFFGVNFDVALLSLSYLSLELSQVEAF